MIIKKEDKNKMYQIKIGETFSRTHIDGESVILSVHAEFIEPVESEFRHWNDDGVEYKELNYNDIFFWYEVKPGIYRFGLFRKKCREHNNKPYYWSSNCKAFSDITGIKSAYVGNRFAVDISMLGNPPEGWCWDKNYLFLIREQK